MLNVNYVAGLVDSLGNFALYVRDPARASQVKRRPKIEPRFQMKIAEKDKDILYQLKDFFNCGNIYFQKEQRQNHQHFYRYEVSNRKDLETIIVPFFFMHPLQRASQKKAFDLFCEAMRRIKKGEHLQEHGLRVLYSIKQQV